MRVRESFCADSWVASCVCCAEATAATLSAALCSGDGPQATSANADNVASVTRRGVIMGGESAGRDGCSRTILVDDASGGGKPKLHACPAPRAVVAHIACVIHHTWLATLGDPSTRVPTP